MESSFVNMQQLKLLWKTLDCHFIVVSKKLAKDYKKEKVLFIFMEFSVVSSQCDEEILMFDYVKFTASGTHGSASTAVVVRLQRKYPYIKFTERRKS